MKSSARNVSTCSWSWAQRRRRGWDSYVPFDNVEDSKWADDVGPLWVISGFSQVVENPLIIYAAVLFTIGLRHV